MADICVRVGTFIEVCADKVGCSVSVKGDFFISIFDRVGISDLAVAGGGWQTVDKNFVASGIFTTREFAVVVTDNGWSTDDVGIVAEEIAGSFGVDTSLSVVFVRFVVVFAHAGSLVVVAVTNGVLDAVATVVIAWIRNTTTQIPFGLICVQRFESLFTDTRCFLLGIFHTVRMFSTSLDRFVFVTS